MHFILALGLVLKLHVGVGNLDSCRLPRDTLGYILLKGNRTIDSDCLMFSHPLCVEPAVFSNQQSLFELP
jgi:hypothetical protein